MGRPSYNSTAVTELTAGGASTEPLYIRGRELLDVASSREVRAPFRWADSRWRASEIHNGAELCGCIVAMYARNPVDEELLSSGPADGARPTLGEVVADKVAVLQAQGAVGVIIVNDKTELLHVGTVFADASSIVPVVLISLSSSMFLENGVMVRLEAKRRDLLAWPRLRLA
jgi:hypothetical protein